MKAVQGEKKHLRRYSVFGIGGLFFSVWNRFDDDDIAQKKSIECEGFLWHLKMFSIFIVSLGEK